MHLPAARLGQRAATAFVATPARRDACAASLSPSRVGFYLNETGLFAMNAGDLATAREYLPMAVRHARDAEDLPNLSAACGTWPSASDTSGIPARPGRPPPRLSPAPRAAVTRNEPEILTRAWAGWRA